MKRINKLGMVITKIAEVLEIRKTLQAEPTPELDLPEEVE